MIEAPTPEFEPARLASLRGTGLLVEGGTESLDRVTRLAQHLFDVPIALVSLVDEFEQCFVSRQGVPFERTPRDVSFCGHAVAADDVLIVQDAHRDERFADNPLVTGESQIRFYAGHPIHGEGGFPVGTLCVMSREPRIMTPTDLAALADLAAIVESEINTASVAMRDQLTGLLNRRGLDAVADPFFEHAKRTGESFAVVMADLDRLKMVNDVWGHAEGDASIRSTGDLLRRSFRSADTIARTGGDEFVVIMPDTDREQVELALERVDEGETIAHELDDLAIQLNVSVGAAVWPEDAADSFDELLELADKRMYRNKQAGRVDS